MDRPNLESCGVVCLMLKYCQDLIFKIIYRYRREYIYNVKKVPQFCQMDQIIQFCIMYQGVFVSVPNFILCFSCPEEELEEPEELPERIRDFASMQTFVSQSMNL